MFEEIIVNQVLQGYSFPLLDYFFQAITYFGNPILWVVIGAWLFWLGKEKKSFMIISIALFATVVSGVLKYIIARPRPVGLRILETQITPLSMPSGHATLAGTIYTFIEKKVYPKEKILLLILVILTAVSRLYLGVHYLSDVLVGLLLGYILGKILLRVEKKVEKSHLKITKFKEEYLLVILFIVIAGLILFLPSEFNAAYALIGYYIGFVIYRDSKFTIKTENKKLNLLFGTIILGIIAFFAHISTGLLSQALFLLAGIFITLIWPIVLNKTRL